jgi:hypothetical protein
MLGWRKKILRLATTFGKNTQIRIGGQSKRIIFEFAATVKMFSFLFLLLLAIAGTTVAQPQQPITVVFEGGFNSSCNAEAVASINEFILASINGLGDEQFDSIELEAESLIRDDVGDRKLIYINGVWFQWVRTSFILVAECNRIQIF